MIEDLSEPINPKLKDPKAFATACEDVSSHLTSFFSISFFRYWYHYACVKNGSIKGICLVDWQTSVLLSTCY